MEIPGFLLKPHQSVLVQLKIVSLPTLNYKLTDLLTTH